MSQQQTKLHHKFVDFRSKYHAQFGFSKITVDWEYVGGRDEPDKIKDIVFIETSNYSLRSANETSAKHIHPFLWGDSEVVKQFAFGKIFDLSDTESLLDKWKTRWSKKDPFSGFIIENPDEDEVIGAAVMGYSNVNCYTAELASIYRKKYQNCGAGSETTGAILYDWAHYIVENKLTFESGEHLHAVTATALKENAISNHLLLKAGFEIQDTIEKYGAARNHYIFQITNDIKLAGALAHAEGDT